MRTMKSIACLLLLIIGIWACNKDQKEARRLYKGSDYYIKSIFVNGDTVARAGYFYGPHEAVVEESELQFDKCKGKANNCSGILKVYTAKEGTPQEIPFTWNITGDGTAIDFLFEYGNGFFERISAKILQNSIDFLEYEYDNGNGDRIKMTWFKFVEE